MPVGSVIGNGWDVGEDNDVGIAFADFSKGFLVVFLEFSRENKEIVFGECVVFVGSDFFKEIVCTLWCCNCLCSCY